MPGDLVIVHAGEYREWVRPRRGGLSDSRRITYVAADGERPVIKGSERLTSWHPVGSGVWQVTVPNSIFGAFNPFAVELNGDWIVYEKDAPKKHLGEVYLNGRSLFEVPTIGHVTEPARRETARDAWTGITKTFYDPDWSTFVWTAAVGAEETTIWANFHGQDPNIEITEINVRPSVFFPDRHGIDYITVRGFELAQAATPWTPPTADQPGLIGPNWSKGWIIEDNFIHDAKCSAVSLGKEISSGHNYMTDRGDRPGYQYQIESVFSARAIGWDRERIGSHIVRRNTIFDCGQNGVVGHLGGAFSTIAENHIYNIGTKHEFYGYEIAGIKMHAPIDVTLVGNRIHHCVLGTWLDWEVQGTRVSRNIYHHNRRDIFIEVSHGPYVVDNNVFASPASMEIMSQGGAFIHNLFAGAIRFASDMDRATPYHRPHSTEVAGFAVIYGGDDRFIANMFLGSNELEGWAEECEAFGRTWLGTDVFDHHPASFDEYMELIDQRPPGTHKRFIGVPQAVYIRDNVYANGAKGYAHEHGAVTLTNPVTAQIDEDYGQLFMEIDVPPEFATSTRALESYELPPVRFAGLDFESRDGSPLTFVHDVTGEIRSGNTVAGPFSALQVGTNRIRLS
ncbi:right-handed parallel beta-helix repeat-containing protein [Paenarthrobacter sp. NPDC089714]|uniref:right-handed parallel beta-helix repeat-containing protein n=1 Tax=Paenarthrobacter sp. NPDC089714 TaxID=3364377 RepID=UPI0038137BAB